VLPLLEDKKAKWKAKLQGLLSDRDKVSQELVQLDIQLRDLDEKKSRLAAYLQAENESEPPQRLRAEYDKLLLARDEITREIERIVKESA
jgi:chromosome segregation ATPase